MRRGDEDDFALLAISLRRKKPPLPYYWALYITAALSRQHTGDAYASLLHEYRFLLFPAFADACRSAFEGHICLRFMMPLLAMRDFYCRTDYAGIPYDKNSSLWNTPPAKFPRR